MLTTESNLDKDQSLYKFVSWMSFNELQKYPNKNKFSNQKLPGKRT